MNERSKLENEARQTDIDTRTLELLFLGDSKIKLTANLPLNTMEKVYYRFVECLNMHLVTLFSQMYFSSLLLNSRMITYKCVDPIKGRQRSRHESVELDKTFTSKIYTIYPVTNLSVQV